MTTSVTYHKGNNALITVGAAANYVVSIYAAILGVLNLIGFLAEPWFLLFYIFLPLPFMLQNVFKEMRQDLVPETYRGIVWHPWVWFASFLGIAVSIGTGAWLVVSITEWLARDKSFNFTDYLMIGFPVSMFIGALALLVLLIGSIRS